MHAAMAIAAVVIVVLALLLFRRRETGYDVDKFEKARSLTTEWARRSSALPGQGTPADAAAAREDTPPSA